MIAIWKSAISGHGSASRSHNPRVSAPPSSINPARLSVRKLSRFAAGCFKKLAVIFSRPLPFERLDNSSRDGRKPGPAFRQRSRQPDGKNFPATALPFRFLDCHPFLVPAPAEAPPGISCGGISREAPGACAEIRQKSTFLASPALLKQAGRECLHLSSSLIRQTDKPRAPSLRSQRQHGAEDFTRWGKIII